MAEKNAKLWRIGPPPEGVEQDSVKIESLDAEVDVIAPGALSDTQIAIAGVISATRSRTTEDEGAVAVFDGIGRADVLDRLRLSKLVGYLPTTVSGIYIEVRRRRRLLIVLLVFLALLLISAAVAAVLWFTADAPWNPNIDPNQGDPAENARISASAAEGETTIAGYADVVDVDAEHPLIPLVNPEGNHVYFSFTVTSGGQEVYRSELVEPGKAVNWDAYSSFGGQAGTYSVVLTTDSRAMDNGAVCNGGVQEFSVRVN